MQNEGPTPKPLQYTCRGCKYLKKDYWTHYNGGDVEYGMHGICTKTGTYLSAQYQDYDNTPNWCPLLPETTNAER